MAYCSQKTIQTYKIILVFVRQLAKKAELQR